MNCAVSGVAAIIISGIFGWKLGLAILGVTPLMLLAGVISMKLHTGDQKRDTVEGERAGNVI